MAERILLGKRGSDYGLFIAKPGLVGTIASADREDLLFASTDLHSSSIPSLVDITISNGTATSYVDISNFGYIPFVMWTQIDGDNIIGQRWEVAISFPYNIQLGTEFLCKVTSSRVTMFRVRGNVSGNKTFRIAVLAIPAS